MCASIQELDADLLGLDPGIATATTQPRTKLFTELLHGRHCFHMHDHFMEAIVWNEGLSARISNH